jgi:hypothetical protein
MKYTYFVITEENENGKTFSHAEKVPNCYNLLNYFHACYGFKIVSIDACETFKRAKEVADVWNTGYREYGIYAFQ